MNRIIYSQNVKALTLHHHKHTLGVVFEKKTSDKPVPIRKYLGTNYTILNRRIKYQELSNHVRTTLFCFLFSISIRFSRLTFVYITIY